MSWTTAAFVSSLVFVLSCSTCAAGPVNGTTSYPCITDDDCKADNISGYSTIRSIRYCCRSGDAIEFSFKSSRYGFVNSFFGFADESRARDRLSTNDSNSSDSEDSSYGRFDSEQEDSSSDQSDDNKREDDNGEIRCTCKQVDREKIRHRFDKFMKEMYRKLDRWSRFWLW